MLGENGKQLSSLKETGDSLDYIRKTQEAHPNHKGFVTFIGDKACISLTHPKYIRALSTKQAEFYCKTKFIEVFKLLVPSSLLFIEGKQHSKIRAILSKSFHHQLLHDNIPNIVNCVKGFFEDAKDLDKLDLLASASVIAGETVGTIFFGNSHKNYKIRGKLLPDFNMDLIAKLGEITKSFWNMFVGVNFIKRGILKKHSEFLADVKEFRDFIGSIVLKRKDELKLKQRGQESQNLLESLLKLNQENSLTEDEIIDQYITFLLAGQDTTSHVITMALIMLAQHPEYIDKIRNELKENVENVENPHNEEINRLEILQAFIKETLRLYSPANQVFYREAQADHKLDDVVVKKGTIVFASLISTSHNPNYFEKGNEFNPHRWIDPQPKHLLEDQFAAIPFWAGNRNCIGQHLAMLETKVVLAYILAKYDFTLPKDFVIKMRMKFVYSPAEKVEMAFTKRK